MKTDDFDYYLPECLIAQTPIEKRDTSRLMILDKNTGKITHKRFSDIIDYLNPGDTLVLNDTKVIPARLIGHKIETDAVIEVLMLKDLGNDEWECLTRPAKRIKEGTIVKFSDELSCKCNRISPEARCVMVKNDFDIDVKVKCLEERVTQAQLAEMVGTSAPYISRLINKKDGIVNKVFVEMLEKLGYDIQITYVKKTEN